MNLYEMVLNHLAIVAPQQPSTNYLSLTQGMKYRKFARLNRTSECSKWIQEDFEKQSPFLIIEKQKILKIIQESKVEVQTNVLEQIQSEKVLISSSGEICEANPV